jgi:hypothetical protein
VQAVVEQTPQASLGRQVRAATDAESAAAADDDAAAAVAVAVSVEPQQVVVRAVQQLPATV